MSGPGVTYRMDLSDDLVTWSTLGYVTANTNGSIQPPTPMLKAAAALLHSHREV